MEVGGAHTRGRQDPVECNLLFCQHNSACMVG